MKLKLTSRAAAAGFVGTFLFLSMGAIRVHADDIKLESQLIWATNDPGSTDSKQKPVDPDVRKKLGDLPLRWAHYFQVCKKRLDVPENVAKKTTMSDKCEIEVKSLKGTKVEVSLYGKGELVWQRTQCLPKGEILVLGGNAPNATAWLVTLKRIE